MDIYNEVINLIAQVLEVSSAQLSEDTAIGDIPTWDSLRQLMIVSTIEENFSIQFEPEVIMDMEDISDIVAAVEERIQS